jgi:hypothetical protein
MEWVRKEDYLDDLFKIKKGEWNESRNHVS